MLASTENDFVGKYIHVTAENKSQTINYVNDNM